MNELRKQRCCSMEQPMYSSITDFIEVIYNNPSESKGSQGEETC
jgi:hypothetical protein